MEFLFNIPYLVPILVVVGVFVLYTQLASRLSIRLPQLPTSPDDLLGALLGARYKEAKLEKTIAGQKKIGNFLNAGRLYEEADKPQKAVDAYLEGNEHFAAASLLEKMGKLERSAELYMQAGDPKKAAQVFATAGKPGKAAALFLEKGNTLEAARLFGVAQDWSKAADLYARGGYPLRAAEAYEKAGDLTKAAECHERHFMENVSFSTSYAVSAPSADQKSALLAGRLFEKGGDLNRAYQIYAKGGYFKDAGSICLRLGQHAKAAELFLRAEDPDSAAQAYQQAGDPVKAANLRGEMALKRDQVPEAARFFQAGEDFLRAAELFESVGMLPEAAGAYEAGESHAAAGAVYIRANLKDRAAAAFERAGEFETAAKLYEESGQGVKAIELYGRAGQTFKSGEAAARAGDREKAIALLQRVTHDDDNYRPATELLASLFIESRMPGLAVERVLKVLGGQEVSPVTLDLYYWLAAGYEASGNAPEALSIYKKILSEDLSFRDVEKRVARLQFATPSGPSVAPSAPPPVPAPPPPAAPPPAAAIPPAAPAAIPPMSPPVVAPTAPPAVAPAVVPAPVATAPPPAAPRPAGPRPPRLVPKEELGRGPLGPVFRAEDQVDGRNVALRMLPPELIAGSVLKELAQDLKAAAQLSHPNLVKVLGLVEVTGRRCVVSEYVQGRTFAEALKLGHKMTFQQAHGLGRVLAQTLEFVHSKGLVHGSLQPSNVMVAAGVVKLADLGLARLAIAVPRQLDYAAPEKQADVAGDIFALAAVLYHLLTGVHPRSQPQGVALPLPSKLAPGVPEAFDKLLLRCLHPRVDLRLPSAGDVLRELKDMVKIG